MSKLVRSIKNVTNGYSSSQVKVRKITANNDDTPSTSEMQDVAELTFQNHELFLIMDMIDKRLNDKGKYWRHVHKSLILLDYLVHYGSDNVIIWCRENLYIIKTLREFQHIDENGRDSGRAIRSRAKELTSLLQNTERLRSIRNERREPSSRRRNRYSNPDIDSGPRQSTPRNRSTRGDEMDDEMRRAIELSKQSAAEDDKRRAQMRSASQEDIQRAIQISQENGRDLFNGNLIDTSADPYPVQNVNTGYLAYGATGQAPYQDQDQLQAYHQAQQLYQQQQAELQRQWNEQQAHIAALEQQLQATQTGLQQFEQPQYQQPLEPVKTGSNNPFASFNMNSAPAPSQPVQPPQQERPLEQQSTGRSMRRQSAMIAQHAEKLEAVLTGNEIGADSFGNTGSQRIPAQHTASKFINSAGHGVNQISSNNPFVPQQYTGIATTQMQPAYTGYGFGNAEASRSSSNLIDL